MSLVEKLVEINTNMLSELVVDIANKHPNVDVEQIVLKAISLKLLDASGAAMIYANLPKRALRVVKSEFGHFVVTPDKLILDLETKCVVGKEDVNGNFEKLTKETIQLCHKYKLRYELPLNLESSEENNTTDTPRSRRNLVSKCDEKDIIKDLGLGHAISSDEEDNGIS
jgi:hypothetical protein